MSSGTWVSRVPEFGSEEAEHNNASHMEDGGVENAPTVDAGGLGSVWSGRSSSGVGSTPETGSHHGPVEGIEQTPGAASSISGLGSVPPELQKKLKKKMEQMKANKAKRNAGGRNKRR